jgi:hypothetical protein
MTYMHAYKWTQDGRCLLLTRGDLTNLLNLLTGMTDQVDTIQLIITTNQQLGLLELMLIRFLQKNTRRPIVQNGIFTLIKKDSPN